MISRGSKPRFPGSLDGGIIESASSVMCVLINLLESTQDLGVGMKAQGLGYFGSVAKSRSCTGKTHGYDLPSGLSKSQDVDFGLWD